MIIQFATEEYSDENILSIEIASPKIKGLTILQATEYNILQTTIKIKIFSNDLNTFFSDIFLFSLRIKAPEIIRKIGTANREKEFNKFPTIKSKDAFGNSLT